MSDPNDSTLVTGTIDGDGVSLSSTFLEFCAKVRNNDPSILPERGKPFNIRSLSEREGLELTDALLENTSVAYLKLYPESLSKSSAEAMAKYVRTSKRLQRIHWPKCMRTRAEIFCCLLPAFQESTSLKELHMELPTIGEPANLAFENMLTRTQSLRSLTLIYPAGLLVEEIAVAAVQSGLKKNSTLRELTLEFSWFATTFSPILTSLRDHPLLRRLCLRGYMTDLDGLETVLLSDNSKITELEIHRFNGCPLMRGMTHVLQALGRRPTLTKLGLRHCPLVRKKARLLRMVLYNNTSLQSLVVPVSESTLGSAGLAELAPALHLNTSIKVLDKSESNLAYMESAQLLRGILRSNKTMTTLELSRNTFGRMAGAADCIVEGLGSNSTLRKIDLSWCHLRDDHVSTLARNLGSRKTTLQKLSLKDNYITSTGVGVLLEMMEHSNHITDLELERNLIGDEGAMLLARSLGNNALPNLTRLSLLIAIFAMRGS